MKKFYQGFISKGGIVFLMALMFGVLSWGSVYGADLNNYVPKKDYSVNLVANYKFEETSGTTCVDSKGSYNGTYSGTTSVLGISGNAREFDGISNHINFTEKVIPLGGKSVKFKIKKDELPITNQVLLSTGWFTTDTNGFSVYIDTNGKLHMYSTRGILSNSRFNLVSTVNICDGNWHDILFTWDGTTNSNGAKIYIDNFVTINSQTNASVSESDVYSDNLYIGGSGKSTSGDQLFSKVVLDEIEIYNTVIEYMNKVEAVTNRAVLTITMTNGQTKEYDLPMSEVDNFIQWYNNNNTLQSYKFVKNYNIKPFKSRTEYIAHSAVSSFEVNEYTE